MRGCIFQSSGVWTSPAQIADPLMMNSKSKNTGYRLDLIDAVFCDCNSLLFRRKTEMPLTIDSH